MVAGTFDGIFLTRILGVLLAVIFRRRDGLGSSASARKVQAGRPELLAVSRT